jgi:hypothetical protein
VLGYLRLRRNRIAVLAVLVALLGASYAAAQSRHDSMSTPILAPSPIRAAAAHARWRDPGILTAIKSAGQRVVSQKVITVAANSPWIYTGLSVPPGAHVWFDTRSDGTWSGNPRYFPYSDARGLRVYPGQYRVDAKAAVLSLIGFIGGSPPTPSEVSVGVSAHPGGAGGLTNPGFIEIGNTLLNLAPRTTGPLSLRNNDNTNYISDVGRQIVKVIVTHPRP